MKVVSSKSSQRLLSKNNMAIGEVFASSVSGLYWMVCKHLGGRYVLNLETGNLCAFEEFNSDSVYYRVSGAFVVDGDSNDA